MLNLREPPLPEVEERGAIGQGEAQNSIPAKDQPWMFRALSPRKAMKYGKEWVKHAHVTEIGVFSASVLHNFLGCGTSWQCLERIIKRSLTNTRLDYMNTNETAM